MSYVKKNGRSRSPLGAAVESYLTTATQALSAMKNVLDDPALPEVTKIALDLHKMEQPLVLPGIPPPPKVPGIGLKRLVKPLRYYHYTRKNRWVLPVGVILAVGLPFLFGYAVGKGRRK